MNRAQGIRWAFAGAAVIAGIDFYRHRDPVASIILLSIPALALGAFGFIRREIRYRSLACSNPSLRQDVSDDRVRLVTGLGLIVLGLAWLWGAASFSSESFRSSLVGVIAELAAPVFLAGLGAGFIWVSIDRRQKAAEEISNATDS